MLNSGHHISKGLRQQKLLRASNILMQKIKIVYRKDSNENRYNDSHNS